MRDFKQRDIRVKLWDKEEKRYVGAYSRACHDEVEWPTEEEARASNIHHIYKDKNRYEAHEFEVQYIRVKGGREY